MVMGLMGGSSLVGVGLLVWWVTRAAASGTLARNGGVGIRTPSTTASDAAWVAGHRGALAGASRLALWCVVTGVLLTVAGAASGDEPGVAAIALFVVGYGGVLAGLVPVVRAADRAAQDADRRSRAAGAPSQP